MQVVIRYECSACGWRWSREMSARTACIPQPAPPIIVPRELGPCECEESNTPAPE